MFETPQHYLAGKTPIRISRMEGGGVAAEYFDVDAGRFILEPTLWSYVDHDRSGMVREVGQAEFDQAVEHLRVKAAV